MIVATRIWHPSLVFKIGALFFAVFFAMSCNKSVRISPTEYDGVDPGQAKYWRVVTTDGLTYWVENFDMTDSAIVILQASRYYESPDAAAPVYLTADDLPIVVSLDDVLRVEKRVKSRSLTAAAIGVGVGLLASLVLLIGWAAAVSS